MEKDPASGAAWPKLNAVMGDLLPGFMAEMLGRAATKSSRPSRLRVNFTFWGKSCRPGKDFMIWEISIENWPLKICDWLWEEVGSGLRPQACRIDKVRMGRLRPARRRAKQPWP